MIADGRKDRWSGLLTFDESSSRFNIAKGYVLIVRTVSNLAQNKSFCRAMVSREIADGIRSLALSRPASKKTCLDPRIHVEAIRDP
jgi:hypothetical protein